MSNKLKQDLSIGQNLKALRKKANLTQREIQRAYQRFDRSKTDLWNSFL